MSDHGFQSYIKLAEPPLLVINAPSCGACAVDVRDEDGDGWKCPSCGTTWAYSDGFDTPGELYESWSGEVLPGQPIPEQIAWLVPPVAPDGDRQKLAEELMEANS